MKNQRQGLSRRSFIAGVAGSSLMMSMGSLVSYLSNLKASKETFTQTANHLRESLRAPQDNGAVDWLIEAGGLR